MSVNLEISAASGGEKVYFMTSSTLTFRSSLKERGSISCGDGSAGRLAVHQSLNLIGDRSTVQYAVKKCYLLLHNAVQPHRRLPAEPAVLDRTIHLCAVVNAASVIINLPARSMQSECSLRVSLSR